MSDPASNIEHFEAQIFLCESASEMNEALSRKNNCVYLMLDPLKQWTNLQDEQIFESLGLLPPMIGTGLLSEKDTIKVTEEEYGFPISHFDGFTLNKDFSISYPDDPDLYPCGVFAKRNERVLVYPYAWVVFIKDVNKPQDFFLCRMN